MEKTGHVNLEMPDHGIVERRDQCAWIFHMDALINQIIN